MRGVFHLMIIRRLALSAISAFVCGVTSCATTETPDTPEAPAPGVVTAANPLPGIWKFDYTKSVVHNSVYAANAGHTDAQQAQTKKFLELSSGSTVTFTGDTITTRTLDGQTASMKYTAKSVDAAGNVVIANPAGAESSYSVSGDMLINTAPELGFVSVYKKSMPYFIP